MSELKALSQLKALSETTAARSDLQLTCANRLVTVFNNLFEFSEQTTLKGGEVEPFYQAKQDTGNIIYFKEDFAASALHEVAHWCLAGDARRRLDDYGYWYEPVRLETDQRKFEQVEVRPQALEWILSVAAGLPFRVSVDNLELPDHDSSEFRNSVQLQALRFVQAGLPIRAVRFAAQLTREKMDYSHPGHYARLPN